MIGSCSVLGVKSSMRDVVPQAELSLSISEDTGWCDDCTSDQDRSRCLPTADGFDSDPLPEVAPIPSPIASMT